MKKILIFNHAGSIGGAGVSLIHIMRAIDKKKYEVTVVCPNHTDELKVLLENEGCNVLVSKTSPAIFASYNGGIKNVLSIPFFVNILRILKDKKNIENYIKEINPDIVAVNSMTLCHIGKIAKRLNKETICFHRETYLKGLFGFRNMFIKNCFSKWFDKVAFISWNDLNETGNINSIKKVIYDRVDISSFNSISNVEARNTLSFKDDVKYILYLGGINELKGSHVMTAAMSYINDKNVKLVFVTNEDIKPYTFKNCTSLRAKLRYILGNDIMKKTFNDCDWNNLSDKLIFLKETDNPQLYFKACDVVVFPSTLPHQARPLYEAGISKIPMIITDFEQTKEFAQNGLTAITFENGNSVDLANKIKSVLSGNIDTDFLISNNYNQSQKNHSLDDLSVEINDLFEFENSVKFLMYGHGGSNNHGCEAIVRATYKIIKHFIKNPFFELSTIDYNSDIKNKLYADKYISNPLKFSYNFFDRLYIYFVRKIIKKPEIIERQKYKVLLRYIRSTKENHVFLSVGGDNYCCDNPVWLYEINKAIDKRGFKRILWGCSVEPVTIDDKMIRDLSGYKLIVARESITYEALKSKGIKSNIVLYPDPAFLLDTVNTPNVPVYDYGNSVGINFSPVVRQLSNDNLVYKAYKNMINYIIDNTSYNVVLVPHVNIEGNNDYENLKKFYNSISKKDRVFLVNEDLNACELKYVISRCKLFVAARTHASIAAYSTAVPTLVVGYSVKANGIAKDIFKTYENYVIPVQTLKNEEDLTNAFKWLQSNEEGIRLHLQSFMPAYCAKANDAGMEIQKLIQEN